MPSSLILTWITVISVDSKLQTNSYIALNFNTGISHLDPFTFLHADRVNEVVVKIEGMKVSKAMH